MDQANIIALNSNQEELQRNLYITSLILWNHNKTLSRYTFNSNYIFMNNV